MDLRSHHFKGREPSGSIKKAASGCNSKTKLWTIKMDSARKMSANKAADLHGVPRLMLKDRLSGRVTHGPNSGPKP